MSATFPLPLQQVIPGQLIASALWNGEWNNLDANFIPAGMDSYSDTDAQMQLQTNPYPGSVTSHATSLGGEIERIRYQIAQILGTDFWYKAPVASIATTINSIIPIGTIIDYPSATVPNSNFHLADGTAINRVLFPALFTLIGTTFGVGDGTTTFNLPNYVNLFSAGAGDQYALGQNGGTATITLTNTQLPSHNHPIIDPGHNHTVSDPTHSHGVTDPGHVHGIKITGTGGSSAAISTPPSNTNVANNFNTNSATTGLTINNASTGITNVSNTTGITTDNTGDGAPFQSVPPYIGMYKMIRVI